MSGNASGITHGTSAFLVTDENSGSYWYDGLWVERAIYAALEAGPIGGGSDLQWSVVSNATGSAGPHEQLPQHSAGRCRRPAGTVTYRCSKSSSVSSCQPQARIPPAATTTRFRPPFASNSAMTEAMSSCPASNAAAIRITPDANGESERRGLRHQRSEQCVHLPRPEEWRHHHQQLAHSDQLGAGRFVSRSERTRFSRRVSMAITASAPGSRSATAPEHVAEICPSTMRPATSLIAVSPPLRSPSLPPKSPQDMSRVSKPLVPRPDRLMLHNT